MADYTGSFSGSFTGSLLSTNGVISSSAQVVGSLPIGVISGSDQLPSGLISGSAQIVPTDLTIDYFNLTNLPVTITPFQANSILANSALRDNFATNVKNRLNAENVLSGSQQVKDLLPDGTISGSSQLYSDLDARYGNEEGDGLISGSSQVDFGGISNVPDGLVSSSTQITDVVTDTYMSASIAASGFGDVPDGTISSSAQISALGYITSETDAQTLSIAGNQLSISNGNSVTLPQAGVGSGASIWNTGSQDPAAYTYLQTQNNLRVTGSFDIQGDLTVNGKSVFIQDVGTDDGLAVEVQGRMKILEKELAGYIASASIQIGGTKDSIDCGGFF